MLKRTRPTSPPPRSSIPFEFDINVPPALIEYTPARELKRLRIFSTITPDSTVVMSVHAHGWPAHSHDHYTASNNPSKRRRSSPEAMEEDHQDAIASSDSARATKRSRIVAPSLDGKSRGWEPPSPPTTHSSSSSYGDSIERGDEDYEPEWDIEEDKHVESNSSPSEEWKANMSEYRDANTLLHTLHAQSRLRIEPTFYNHPSHAQQPSPPPSIVDSEFNSQGRTNTETADAESQLVKERYEERNKLLGSLFLSRRRDLYDTISIPS